MDTAVSRQLVHGAVAPRALRRLAHPAGRAHPTLAEYLGSRGYATAGFVANMFYCGADTGLGRGFTAYRDYFFAELSAFKMAALIDRPVEGLRSIDRFPESTRINSTFSRLRPLCAIRRRESQAGGDGQSRIPRLAVRAPAAGAAVLRLLELLSMPTIRTSFRTGASTDSGRSRATTREIELIENWRTVDKRRLSAREIAFVRDSYDDCIADLDEQLGRLLDELGRRGILERTWLIVTSDHGESFGEQAGVFGHGTSLYQPQLHVPLVIVPPRGAERPSRPVVPETASLRDLPATIVDVLGLRPARRSPVESLATLWGHPSSGAVVDPTASGLRPSPRSSRPIPSNPDPAQLLERRQAWASLAEGDWIYIRREGIAQEELFDLRADPRERHNLAEDPATRPVLERMRADDRIE